MPPRNKEERKRGKKRKRVPGDTKGHNGKAAIEEAPAFFVDRQGANGLAAQDSQSKPSWLVEKPVAGSSSLSKVDESTPFGLVDLDLKAYLRTTHIKLEEFMEAAIAEGRAVSEDEEVKNVRNAMLDEIKGKELTLATDGDASRVLEDMLTCFSPRQTRILADALAKSSEDLEKLACHRFGSHLLQSTLVILQEASAREKRDLHSGKKSKDKIFSESGDVLRTAQQLVLDVSKDLTSKATKLLADPFGTHVLRTLLLVLAGRGSLAIQNSRRSKRSKAYREKLQSAAIARHHEQADHTSVESFKQPLAILLSRFEGMLDTSELKRLSRDAITAPTLALIIELSVAERDQHIPSTFFLDNILGGSTTFDKSDYVEDLMKDEIGSHVIQSLLSHSPEHVVIQYWLVYIRGRLCKLGSHPIANFIVAIVVKRMGKDNEDFVSEACKEIELAGDLIVKNKRIGILLALVQNAAELSRKQEVVKVAPNEIIGTKKNTVDVWNDETIQSKASRAILAAFGFDEERIKTSEEDQSLLIKVLMSGKTRKSYLKEIERIREDAKKKAEKRSKGDAEGDPMPNGHEPHEEDGLLMSTQGSLLCQSLISLREPGSTPLLDSVLSLPSLLPICNNPTTVHIILAPLQPEADCSFSQRKLLSTKILAELTTLLKDKFGSRVIDIVFDRNDAFVKEKILRKCVEEEQRILSSNYGRYFLKRVDIALFRKSVGQWKQKIATKKVANDTASQRATEAIEIRPEKKQKIKSKVEVELDSILANI